MLLFLDLRKAKHIGDDPGQLGLFGGHKPPAAAHSEEVRVAAHTRHTEHGDVQVPSHLRLVMRVDHPHPDQVAAARSVYDRMSNAEEDDIGHAEAGRTVRHPGRAASRRAFEQAKAEWDTHPKHVQDAAIKSHLDETEARHRALAGRTGFRTAPGTPPVKPGQYVKHPSSGEWYSINHVEPHTPQGQSVYGHHRPDGPGNTEADRADIDSAGQYEDAEVAPMARRPPPAPIKQSQEPIRLAPRIRQENAPAKKTGQPPKGTPTGTNASSLHRHLLEHGGRVPPRVHAVSAPHISRTIKAGWAEKDPEGPGFRLTEKGREGLRSHGYEPPPNAVSHLD